MLLRILLLLTLLLLLPIWFIDRWCLRERCPKWLRVCCALPNVVLWVALVALAVNESYSASADHWKGLLIGSALCLIVPETLAFLLLGIGRGLQRCGRWRKNPMRWVAAGVGCASFCAMLYGFTAGYRKLTVKEFAYRSTRLPQSFDGYRIVQLSDLHLGTLSGHEEVVDEIVERVNALNPDLIVFTGDLVNYRAEEVDAFRSILSRLHAADGVMSIMGNHDYAQYYRHASPADSLADIRRLQQAQREMGWDLLLNEHRLVRRGSDSIAIVGVENDGRPPFPARGDLRKACRGLAPQTFCVLLSHDPTHWRRKVLPETEIDLTLSGHTHGMQFKMGGFSPAAWIYDEWGGAYFEGQRALYVSLGTGQVLVPFRLGAWPEINVITLRRAAAGRTAE